MKKTISAIALFILFTAATIKPIPATGKDVFMAAMLLWILLDPEDKK